MPKNNARVAFDKLNYNSKPSEVKASAVLFLEEDGDIPVEFVYVVSTMGCADDALVAEIVSMREKHFKDQGKSTPLLPAEME